MRIVIAICVGLIAGIAVAQTMPAGSQRQSVLGHALWIQVIVKEGVKDGGGPLLTSEEKIQVKSEAQAILDDIAAGK